MTMATKYPHLGFDPQDFDSLYSYHRGNSDCETFLFFAICVAGKNSATTAKGLDKLIAACGDPMWLIDDLIGRGKDWTISKMKECGLGCYNQRWESIVSIDKYTDDKRISCLMDINELKKIKGVGNKTARFFKLYSYTYQRLAVIDTHIWKQIQKLVPELEGRKPPTSNKEYEKWEQFWLDHIETSSPVDGHDYYARADFNGWKEYV